MDDFVLAAHERFFDEKRKSPAGRWGLVGKNGELSDYQRPCILEGAPGIRSESDGPGVVSWDALYPHAESLVRFGRHERKGCVVWGNNEIDRGPHLAALAVAAAIAQVFAKEFAKYPGLYFTWVDKTDSANKFWTMESVNVEGLHLQADSQLPPMDQEMQEKWMAKADSILMRAAGVLDGRVVGVLERAEIRRQRIERERIERVYRVVRGRR